MAVTSYIGSDGFSKQVAPSSPLPVDIGGASVNITGPVTVANEVEIKNDSGNPVPASVASLPLPTGAATAANQATANTSLANLDTDLGALADAAASSDTGSFSVIALIKRGLQNWTTLLARIPALSAGRFPTEPLGQADVSRKLTAGATSANTALTSTCRRVTMRAVTADIRYSIGTTAQTATTNSHFIASGERLDLAVPAGANIAVIRDAATSGTLELTELV